MTKNIDSGAPVCKTRAVACGDNVRNRENIFVTDTTLAPTIIPAVRTALVHGAAVGSGASQADGEMAFAQPLLPAHIAVSAILSEDLLTDKLHAAVKTM